MTQTTFSQKLVIDGTRLFAHSTSFSHTAEMTPATANTKLHARLRARDMAHPAACKLFVWPFGAYSSE